MRFYLTVKTTSTTSQKPPLDARCLLLNSEGETDENEAPSHDYDYDEIDLPGVPYQHRSVRLAAGVSDDNGASCEISSHVAESEAESMMEHIMGYVLEAVQKAMWDQEVVLKWIPRIEGQQSECAFINFAEDKYIWWEMVEIEIEDQKYLDPPNIILCSGA